MRTYSTAAPSNTQAMTAKNPQLGMRNTAHSASGTVTAAVKSRCIGGAGAKRESLALALAGGEEVLLPRLDAAVAALPLLEVEDRLEQVATAEVGPEGARHPDLGVRDLPEEEVADPQLPGGADHQVGVGLARRVEI